MTALHIFELALAELEPLPHEIYILKTADRLKQNRKWKKDNHTEICHVFREDRIPAVI